MCTEIIPNNLEFSIDFSYSALFLPVKKEVILFRYEFKQNEFLSNLKSSSKEDIISTRVVRAVATINVPKTIFTYFLQVDNNRFDYTHLVIVDKSKYDGWKLIHKENTFNYLQTCYTLETLQTNFSKSEVRYYKHISNYSFFCHL